MRLGNECTLINEEGLFELAFPLEKCFIYNNKGHGLGMGPISQR
jgi:hypothetical protein